MQQDRLSRIKETLGRSPEVVLHVDSAVLYAVRRVEQPHRVDEGTRLSRGHTWILRRYKNLLIRNSG